MYTLANGGQYTDHDIALIELATSTTAPAIQLATDPADAGLYAAGTEAQVAGWGLTDPSATVLPTQLQGANTGVQSDTYCAEQDYFKTGAEFDSSDQMCTIDAPADATAICHGDSGGPLLAEISGAWTEVGVTSYGTCSPSLPSYFTRVDTYANWIQSWITYWMPPSVSTGSAVPGQFTANVTGQVNPNGSATSYDFQWGTSTSYGNTAGAGSTNNGVGNLAISAQLTGLQAATTYHYRLVATSTNGTTNGSDQTFTTLPAPEWGIYNGRTSQHWPIAIRLNTLRQITHLRFSFTLTCAHHRPSLSISPLADGQTWSLNTTGGMGFSHTFRDTQGARYAISGVFTPTGTSSGTLSSTWRTRRFGACSTARVRWSAH